MPALKIINPMGAISRFSFLAIILASGFGFAVPRFAIENGTSCNLCHVDPAGGGLRTDHGTTIVSTDELPRRYGNTDYTGLLTEHIRTGADIRFQSFSYQDEPDAWNSALFPMQLDVYGYLTVFKNMSLYVEQDILRGNSRFWVKYASKSGKGYLRYGKMIPAYGLRLADHTTFIRGGNLRRKVGLTQEGFPFSPLRGVPATVEAGKDFGPLTAMMSVSNGFIHSFDAGYGFQQEWTEKAVNIRLETAGDLGSVYYLTGTSVLTEQATTLAGVFGGLALGPVTGQVEVDLAKNYIDRYMSLISYTKISLNIMQGLAVHTRFETLDEDRDSDDDELTRITGEISYFPRAFVEIMAQTRFTISNIPNTDSMVGPELVIQIHTWF